MQQNIKKIQTALQRVALVFQLFSEVSQDTYDLHASKPLSHSFL